MKLDILHQLHPTFNSAALGVLKHVATLTTDRPLDQALELAFQQTQNINGMLWVLLTSPELVPQPGVHRSTAIGDIVVADDAKAFQCVPGAWTERDMRLIRVMRMP